MVTRSNNNPKLSLFKNDVKINKTKSDSSQGVIHFGNEVSTGVKIVVKQFGGSNMRGMFHELKIFTFIEKMR